MTRSSHVYYSNPTHNRVAPYLDPMDTADRQEVLGDAVIAAVMALRRMLTRDEPVVVMKAAEMILDLEKTRIRHGRAVSGTEIATSVPPKEVPVEPSAALEPLEEDLSDDEFIEQHTERVWRELQAIADEKKTGEVVPREMAERMVRAALRDAQNLSANPPPGRS